MTRYNSLAAAALLALCGAVPVRAQDVIAAAEEPVQAGETVLEVGDPAAEAAAAKDAVQPEPAPVPAAAPVFETVSAAKVPYTQDSSEWDYLKKAAAGDKAAAEIILPQVTDWLVVYPSSEYAADAQLLKARLHLKLGDHRRALTDLLKYFQCYPKAASMAEARKLFKETADRKAGKDLRAALEELSAEPGTGDEQYHLSLLLERLAVRAGGEFYAPLCEEFREFLNRYPAYAKNDEVRMALADLHRKNGEYLAAKMGYEKLIRLHPGSPLQAGAKLALAGVEAGELGMYDEAIAVYQDVAASYPGSPEAWEAYSRLAPLCERRKKYALAADVHAKIIALYPDRAEAYDSFRAEARLLRDELDKPAEAAAVLDRLADKYKDGRAVEALLLAAEIRRRDMKDTPAEVKTYDRIAAEYPSDAQAPKALYAAGEALEKAGDAAAAKEYYSKTAEKYADSSSAARAKKRLAVIEQSAGGKK